MKVTRDVYNCNLCTKRKISTDYHQSYTQQ